ncbi:uncharacterized protein L201_001691 [Kwoniella dendrophila CBS 6074]|uniref:Pentatricopeptide repeat domain-containing protein n=1 Tax=Kwoniella dendrophila CBS 6074 TaxID=1295534 RepID=A0AAX4JN22_9TREE
MQNLSIRQVSKQLVPSFQLAIRPPLCSRCLRPIHPRQYGSKANSVPRVKKTSSEFSSRGRTLDEPQAGSSRSQLNATDVSLKDNFDALFNSSSSSANPFSDVKRILQAVYPLIFRRDLRPLLDPYLEQISAALSNPSGSISPVVEDVRQVTAILNHCWTRSFALKLSSEKLESLETDYAGFITRQAFDSKQQHGQLILDVLENSLARQVRYGNRIGTSLIAAWAILRAKLETLVPPTFEPKIDYKEEVESYIKQKVSELEENADIEGFMQQLDFFVPSSSLSEVEHIVWNVQGLEKEIDRLRRKGDIDGIVSLWGRFKLKSKLPTAIPDATAKSLSISTSDRMDILSLFLKAFKRASSSSHPLELHFRDALAQCPRPLPRAITQTLLALRIGAGEATPKTGEEVLPLDHEDNGQSRSSGALENLKSTWEQAGEKDLKMYMIYIEGLGRLGDLTTLKEAWNALVKDETAKKLYLQEEKLPVASSATFPPTQALNQMISSCLLIPDGSQIALDLFTQAASPSSSISINIITINTILRHHARQADLPLMSSLFTLADKLKLKPDIITYTTLVQGLLRGGKIDLAKKVIEDMNKQGIPPNERMCSMLISDLSKLGTQKSLLHAEELLNLMIRKRMKINEITWTGLISGYFKSGWEKNGWDTISRMEKNGFKLNRIGYNICFRQFTLSNANNKSQTGGTSQGIMKLWNKMLNDKITPNSDSYLLVLTPLVVEKRWVEANEVLDVMRRRGFRVEKGALQNIVNRVRDRR